MPPFQEYQEITVITIPDSSGSLAFDETNEKLATLIPGLILTPGLVKLLL